MSDLPRETGSEKSGSTCPTCGGALPGVRTGYGSVVAGACPHCSKVTPREVERALEEPSASWKVSDLVKYAEAAGVDLTDVGRNRTELLAAINR